MNISKKTFFSAVIILFILLIAAGILTRILPMGIYDYQVVDGIEQMIPGSYRHIDAQALPVISWFTAPIAVLWTDSGIVVLMIILFLMIIGGSIHVLNEIHLLEHLINRLVIRFKENKWLLIHLITLLFMSLGAFIGIFEEVVPLVPLMILLSKQMGFDIMMGLGISLLATGFGFAAAVSNPFTIGVAQELSSVPIFSGAPYRLLIFAVTYVVLNVFLRWYGHKIENKSEIILQVADQVKGLKFLVGCLLVLMAFIALSPFIQFFSDYNLPIIGLLFLTAGLVSGILAGLTLKETLKCFMSGALQMLPAVVLILLATGIKHIMESGQIMGTVLHYTVTWIKSSSDFTALSLVFLLVLILNFFIGSGSAKAFIVMPLIAPLMDMLGLSRQVAVLAFQLGDGFSNILYPTNAVLLISLGLAGVGYGKWFKWIIKLQLIMLVLSFVYLYIALLIAY